jgi:hypothetical protein
MKGQLKVSTPAEYKAKFEEPRRTEIAAEDGTETGAIHPRRYAGVRSMALQVRKRILLDRYAYHYEWRRNGHVKSSSRWADACR